MITCNVEYLRDMIDELKEHILHSHWEELALNKDKVPLKPNYPLYLQLEELGIMSTVILRKDGKVMGYIIGLIQPHLHYMTCLTYIMDIFYITKDERHAGNGSMLMNTLVTELLRRGVHRAVFNTKLHHPIDEFFQKYSDKNGKYELTHIENLYSMWLGDK